MKAKYLFLLLSSLFIYISVAQNNSFSKILICKDVSLSNKDSDIEKEINFINKYLNNISNKEISFITFSNEVILSNKSISSESSINELSKHLDALTFDGSTSYSFLNNLIKENTYDEIILFSDFNSSIGQLTSLNYDGKLLFINSSDYISMEKVDFRSKSNFFFYDLSNSSIDKVFQSFSENINTTYRDLVYKLNLEKPTEKRDFSEVKGIALIDGEPVEGVLVQLEGTKEFAQTNRTGDYSISAVLGDKLTFTFNNLKPIKKIVDQQKIDVNFDSKINSLNEVVVKANKQKKENLVMTATGLRNENSVGYSVKTIESDQIGTKDIDIGASMNGNFAGVTLGPGGNPGQRSNVLDPNNMVIRGLTSVNLSSNPLIIIDGTPLESSKLNFSGGKAADLGFINPENVKSITVLKSLAATTKYGADGRNGVVIITTKLGQGLSKSKGKVSYDDTKRMLGVDNEYVEKELKKSEVLGDKEYILQLKKASNFDEAFNIYLSLREINYKKPYFFIDVYDHFKKYKNASIANRILSNVLELNFDNAPVLKELALKFEKDAKYKSALAVYDRIKFLRANNADAYISSARLYKMLNDYDKAYHSYESLISILDDNKDVKHIELRKFLITEIKNLVKSYEKNIKSSIKPFYRNTGSVYDARLVFNWTDPDLQFEVDFVNPDNKYYKWSRTLKENFARVEKDKAFGFMSEQFELMGAKKGKWKINLKYIGNKNNKQEPKSFLMTIYHNYGKKNQTKEIKWFRLENFNSEINLAEISLK